MSTIFPHRTEQLVFIGKVDITGSALNMLMRYKINTVFIGKNGRFNGKLYFNEGKNVFLRMKQFKLLEDAGFVLNFSKNIVGAKLKNQLHFAQRIGRKKNIAYIVNDAIEKMKRNIIKAGNSDDIDQLRGYEGIGARYFFSVFQHSILQDWAVFNGRSKHPPKDNVNAVLSFIYTLIYYRVTAAIESIDLDSYVGYLHAVDYGRMSLAFDLMEEFRAPLGDSLTVALFNLGILNKDDFEVVNFTTESDDHPIEVETGEESKDMLSHEKKGVLLTKEGLKKVIEHFEKKIDTAYYYMPLLQPVSYKKIIREQAIHFKRVIAGQEKEYKPFITK